MRRSESLRLVDAPRSRGLGVLVAVSAVLATRLLVFPLREVTPVVSTGVVYLLAVLLVSTTGACGCGWGS